MRDDTTSVERELASEVERGDAMLEQGVAIRDAAIRKAARKMSVRRISALVGLSKSQIHRIASRK